ncbi:hypothetical protein PLICRDRAFT_47239 [Plicaturopsis crispa FD-325 SS-3]|uniref:Uncharacterized protein n=1 Tax=Plicaturopsis crispa FD-325 SS-3 TaxID=944288 RepID=A0A0C9SVZ0_PLICR|nr:hypothetical protein PLICRDRAFT_47239 [Plicaturopsis crispa FD-325 SS-3]
MRFFMIQTLVVAFAMSASARPGHASVDRAVSWMINQRTGFPELQVRSGITGDRAARNIDTAEAAKWFQEDIRKCCAVCHPETQDCEPCCAILAVSVVVVVSSHDSRAFTDAK